MLQQKSQYIPADCSYKQTRVHLQGEIASVIYSFPSQYWAVSDEATLHKRCKTVCVFGLLSLWEPNFFQIMSRSSNVALRYKWLRVAGKAGVLHAWESTINANMQNHYPQNTVCTDLELFD